MPLIYRFSSNRRYFPAALLPGKPCSLKVLLLQFRCSRYYSTCGLHVILWQL